MDKTKILNEVKKVVADQLDDTKATDIKPSTNIKKDLDLDSLDIFEIVDDLEDAFDIEISTDGKQLDTVQQLVDYIGKQIQGKGSKDKSANKSA